MGVAGLLSQGRHRLTLTVPDLGHQPATRADPARRLLDHHPQVGQPIGPCEQGWSRLPGQHRWIEFDVALGDVGRVGDHHVDLTGQIGRERLEPRATDDSHVGPDPPESGQVGSGHGERVIGAVRRPHGGALDGQLRRARQGDRARSGPQVHHRTARVTLARRLDGHLGHQFGLRAWDEHTTVDHQLDRAKGPRTQHVGQGLTGAASRHHGVDPSDCSFGGRGVESVQPFDTFEPAGLLADPTRLVDITKGLGGLDPQRPPVQVAVVAHPQSLSEPASSRVRSSVCKASTTVSRFPASTSWSW